MRGQALSYSIGYDSLHDIPYYCGSSASSILSSRENCFSILNAKEADNTKPPLSTDTFGNNGGDESETSGSETPANEVVDNEGDMVDALSRVLEQKSLENWKELDNESEDRKVERDAEREGEPNILAPFGSDRGITI
ncbi:hypothetical protein Tco_0499832 [Tanacetum coccineum]